MNIIFIAKYINTIEYWNVKKKCIKHQPELKTEAKRGNYSLRLSDSDWKNDKDQ